MADQIATIAGSVVQHGHHNRRIYVMHLALDQSDRLIPLLDRLAMDDARHVDVAIASHDAALVRHARQLIDEHGLRNWEFQMLYGIGRDLQQQLLGDGYPVRVYVSYGPSWYPWFMRRLAERPANVLFFLRHLLG